MVSRDSVQHFVSSLLIGHLTEEEMREERPRDLESQTGAAPRAR